MKRLLAEILGIGIVLMAIFAVLAVLVGSARGRSSVLSNPCLPPCWQGVVPGQTDSGRAFETLAQMEGVSFRSIMTWEHDGVTDEIGWRFQHPFSDTAGYMHFENDVLTAISILAPGSLSAGDAIDAFGEPEEIWLSCVSGGINQPMRAAMVYPAKGLSLEIDLGVVPATGGQVEMDRSSPVSKVLFFEPQRLEDVATSGLAFTAETPLPIERVPWRGLGQGAFEVPGCP